MLAIWSLVPLPFLKPAWTSVSSWFMYSWSLAWRILSITLLACEMTAIVWPFEHSLALRGFWGIWSESSEEFHHSHFVSCVLSRSVVSDSLWPHGLWPTRLLFPFNSPGKNTGVSCHSLFQGIFLTQGTPVLCANSLPSEPSGKPYLKVTWELCRPNACVLVT